MRESSQYFRPQSSIYDSRRYCQPRQFFVSKRHPTTAHCPGPLLERKIASSQSEDKDPIFRDSVLRGPWND
jgi:hypothetical protein